MTNSDFREKNAFSPRFRSVSRIISRLALIFLKGYISSVHV